MLSILFYSKEIIIITLNHNVIYSGSEHMSSYNGCINSNVCSEHFFKMLF